jgi:hypothetical protein
VTLSAARVRIKNPRAGHPIRSVIVPSGQPRVAKPFCSRYERAKDGASVANLSALRNPPLSSSGRLIPAYGGGRFRLPGAVASTYPGAIRMRSLAYSVA